MTALLNSRIVHIFYFDPFLKLQRPQNHLMDFTEIFLSYAKKIFAKNYEKCK